MKTSKPTLSMPYEETKRVPFMELLKLSERVDVGKREAYTFKPLKGVEVHKRDVYDFKPLKNQGKFGG